ncbi:hypothetical protein HTZ84_20275 [Haloterrigena sp. SYSU A558-1]|uniref:Uncharacterized protein n=1 Tax=Haloterrigena gelatinilytica TaxID=2741724 RepID=A0A8J8GI15_9EURY|nr:hypothetical protein [Haloterrigena gelatinilytica]NUB89565.1 hypothetical protein [Haloterrigena gelatinilytica]NUC74605.1 hypothetical protein [Haloterrigena gelatinilytica]
MAGIIDTIKLAGTLVFALPAAMAGIQFLIDGNTLVGAILVTLAVLLVVIQHHMTTPSDLPELAAKRVVGSVVSEPESEDEDRDIVDVTPEDERK